MVGPRRWRATALFGAPCSKVLQSTVSRQRQNGFESSDRHHPDPGRYRVFASEAALRHDQGLRAGDLIVKSISRQGIMHGASPASPHFFSDSLSTHTVSADMTRVRSWFRSISSHPWSVSTLLSSPPTLQLGGRMLQTRIPATCNKAMHSAAVDSWRCS